MPSCWGFKALRIACEVPAHLAPIHSTGTTGTTRNNRGIVASLARFHLQGMNQFSRLLGICIECGVWIFSQVKTPFARPPAKYL